MVELFCDSGDGLGVYDGKWSILGVFWWVGMMVSNIA